MKVWRLAWALILLTLRGYGWWALEIWVEELPEGVDESLHRVTDPLGGMIIRSFEPLDCDTVTALTTTRYTREQVQEWRGKNWPRV